MMVAAVSAFVSAFIVPVTLGILKNNVVKAATS